jgi:uncharacterized protein (DUF1697 family)
MIQYVAFLRGINVGGKNLIRMDALRGICESVGCKNVRTFIQSGNVIFESANADATALTRKIEKALLRAVGFEVRVALRTLADLEGILTPDPFKKVKRGDDVVVFIAFLTSEPVHTPKLPLHSATENVEVLAIKNGAAFIVCHRKKNGMFSFPNNFLEKQFGVFATTRNVTTVGKVFALANSAGK